MRIQIPYAVGLLAFVAFTLFPTLTTVVIRSRPEMKRIGSLLFIWNIMLAPVAMLVAVTILINFNEDSWLAAGFFVIAVVNIAVLMFTARA